MVNMDCVSKCSSSFRLLLVSLSPHLLPAYSQAFYSSAPFVFETICVCAAGTEQDVE